MSSPSLAEVEEALGRLWLDGGGGARLRREDLKKAREVTALLEVLATLRGPARARRLLVDAAAGHAYTGLLAALLGGWTRVRLIEREPARVRRAEEAVARVRAARPELDVTVAAADVVEQAAWPDAPDVVVALHACGGATDAILDAATTARARWILLVPCCYGRGVPFAAVAEARAEALGIPREAEVRRRFLQSLIDAERVLRLESRGWEVTAQPLCPPTITPHNLLLRARGTHEPTRMSAARARWEALTRSV